MIRLRLVLVAALLVAPPAAAQYQIDNRTAGLQPGTVLDLPVRSSADGEWVVLAVCQPAAAGWCWITGLSRAGGVPVDISGPIWILELESPEFVLSPDGRRVAYLRRGDVAGPREVWTRPVDGSAPAVRLRAAATPDENARSPRFGSDGQQVVFYVNRSGDVDRLRVAPATGGPGGRELDSGDLDWPITLSPSGAHAVYWGDVEDDGEPELRAVALAAGSAWTLDGISAPPFSSASNPRITADGLDVVFSAGLDDPDAPQLWSVPLAAIGPRVRISQELASGSQITEFDLSPGGRAVYQWRPSFGLSQQIWSAPVDGSAAAIRLDGGLVAGGETSSMVLAGEQVAFRADAQVDDRFELWSVPADGSAGRSRRSAALAADRDVTGFAVTPDGARLVYRADGTVDDRLDLYSTTVTGLTSVVRLTNLEPFGEPYSALSYAIADDSRTILYGTTVDVENGSRLLVQDLRTPSIAPQLLTESAEAASFSPLDDGSAAWIEVQLDGDPRAELYFADRRLFADGFESGSTVRWSTGAAQRRRWPS